MQPSACSRGCEGQHLCRLHSLHRLLQPGGALACRVRHSLAAAECAAARLRRPPLSVHPCQPWVCCVMLAAPRLHGCSLLPGGPVKTEAAVFYFLSVGAQLLRCSPNEGRLAATRMETGMQLFPVADASPHTPLCLGGAWQCGAARRVSHRRSDLRFGQRRRPWLTFLTV